MEISALPISSAHKEKLISAGYTNLASLATVSASRLAKELNILNSEALGILKIALQSFGAVGLEGRHPVLKGAQTAWEMFSVEQTLKHISTGSEDFDGILGGGIHCKQVTEVVIDEQFFRWCSRCWQNTVGDSASSQCPNSSCLWWSRGSSNLHSYTEQISVINNLEKFVEGQKDVKIVIIDSISFLFRQDFQDMSKRTRVLGDLSQKLMKLAENFSLAVVLLNQVTSKCVEGSFQLTLALGDTWSHSSTNRVILYWKDNDRYACMENSSSLPQVSAPFSVTSKGIRNLGSLCKRARMM